MAVHQIVAGFHRDYAKAPDRKNHLLERLATDLVRFHLGPVQNLVTNVAEYEQFQGKVRLAESFIGQAITFLDPEDLDLTRRFVEAECELLLAEAARRLADKAVPEPDAGGTSNRARGSANRPEICFEKWGEIPTDDPLAMSPVRQRGFYLANDGGAAHEITVESFEIGASARAKSKMVARIEANGKGFALVWLESYPSSCRDKWDLLGAMHNASLGTHGHPMDMQDYSVTVSVVYRDAAEVWFRSSAEMMFIRSRLSIEFGPTTYRTLALSSQETADVKQAQDRADAAPPSVEANDLHADPASAGGSQVSDALVLGEATKAATESAKAPQPHARGARKDTPRRTVDLKSIRERVELADALARELAIIKQETRAYCTAEGLKRKYPKFTLWTVIEDSQIKELAEGQAFSPRAYAENLMLAKYGLTSREITKKYRRRLRQADKAK